jgi:hypothetical protein
MNKSTLFAIFAITFIFVLVKENGAQTGGGGGGKSHPAAQTGKTTHYWDCCKASCSWPDKAAVTRPVKTCDKSGVKVVGSNGKNVCGGGGGEPESYMCNNNQPWAHNATLSFGFAAGVLKGETEKDWYNIFFNNFILFLNLKTNSEFFA